MICTRTNGIAPRARAANTSHTPTASPSPRPAASTIDAATAAMPTAPHSSGSSRRPRLRTSNDNSTATSGLAIATGASHDQPALASAHAAADPSTTSSTIAIRSARRDRSSQRPRRTSTATNLAGVRSKNAVKAATPNATPAPDHATIRPSNTGSRVRPQPPCSLGIATVRQPARSPTTCSDCVAVITPPPIRHPTSASTATRPQVRCEPQPRPRATHTDRPPGTADQQPRSARCRSPHRRLRSPAAR